MASIANVYGALMVATSVASVCGNLLLLLVVALNKSLRGETWFIGAIATLCNLSFGFSIVPFGAHNSLSLAWGGSSDRPLCQGCAFLLVLLQLGTLNTVVLATTDKFTELCFSLHHAQLFAPKRAVLALGLVWVCSVVGAACPLVGAGAFSYGKTKFLCVPTFAPTHMAYSNVLLVVGNVIPILAMVAMCVGVICDGRNKALRGTFVGNQQQFANAGDYFKSAMGMMLSVACVLVTCSPFLAVCFYETYTGRSLPPTPDAMIIWFMLSPCALDPWLNFLTQKKYRDGLKECMKKVCGG
ncbi:histamine H2 receptor [Conger conger]|uniref:histamine H2 receptor n=1 Tax=Conger conger TaxID=82655 RepID=UPI002A5A1091|nr:histamine H2 receptor [Conger conger]